eukprot:2599162-Rhodomonas_salina.1
MEFFSTLPPSCIGIHIVVGIPTKANTKRFVEPSMCGTRYILFKPQRQMRLLETQPSFSTRYASRTPSRLL